MDSTATVEPTLGQRAAERIGQERRGGVGGVEMLPQPKADQDAGPIERGAAQAARWRGCSKESPRAGDPAVNPRNVPVELRQLPQWICWRLEWKPKSKKPNKVPYQALDSERKAKPNDPATWTTFGEAASALEASGDWFNGLGFLFARDDPYVGIDFDGCLDVDGNLADWAKPWIDRLPGAYMEISPSGLGVKAWCRGRLPGTGKSRPIGEEEHTGIEVYDRGRYFCVTGRQFGDAPTSPLPNHQPTIDELYAWVKARPPKAATKTKSDRKPASPRGVNRLERLINTPLSSPHTVKDGDIRDWHGDLAQDPLPAQVVEIIAEHVPDAIGQRNDKVWHDLPWALVHAGYQVDVLRRMDERIVRAFLAIGDENIGTKDFAESLGDFQRTLDYIQAGSNPEPAIEGVLRGEAEIIALAKANPYDAGGRGGSRDGRRRLATLLRAISHARGGRPFSIDQRTLERLLDIRPRAIRRHRDRLAEDGLIAIEDRGRSSKHEGTRRTARYRWIGPPITAAQATEDQS